MTNLSSVLVDVFERRAEARLDLDEERDLLAAAQSGDETATLRLVLAYAPALRNGVAGYTRALSGGVADPTDLEDVRSQAVLGLLEAIQAWRADDHERLAALAPSYIRNAVSAAAASATGFTVPERTLKRFFGILRAADGDVLTAVRIAPDHAMKAETFLAVLDAVRSVESYDAAVESTSGGFDATTGERFAFGAGRDVVASAIWDNTAPDVEDAILVEAAFRAVSELEADVVRLAYGFVEYDPLPDEEIGHRLGFSRAKTQRLRAGALAKMRTALGVA